MKIILSNTVLFFILIAFIFFIPSCEEEKQDDIISSPNLAPWNNVRYDYSNTGNYPGFGPTIGIIADTIFIGDPPEGLTPIFDNNRNLYIANESGVIYKIDSTNSIVWQFETELEISQSASVHDSVVVWTTREGFIIGFAVLDGRELWRIDTSDKIFNPPIIHNELNFGVVTTDDGILVIFDLNGNVLNSISLGNNNTFTTPISSMDENGNIFIATRNEVYQFDMEGNLIWNKGYNEYHRIFNSFVSYKNNDIFFIVLENESLKKNIISISADNGNINWLSRPYETNEGFNPFYQLTLTDEYIVTSNLFVGIETFDYDGNHIETTRIGEHRIESSVLVDIEKNHFFGSEDGESLISMKENNLNWELTINDYYIYDMSINSNRIYFTTREHPYLWIIE